MRLALNRERVGDEDAVLIQNKEKAVKKKKYCDPLTEQTHVMVKGQNVNIYIYNFKNFIN